MSFDVTLVTYEAAPDGATDDLLVAEALASQGARVRFAVWDDPAVDWTASPITVIRSTWDYFHRPQAFREWIARAGGLTRLVNSRRVVAWNMDKRYLRDLEARGLAIVPTLFVVSGERLDLARACAERGWDEVVIKPTISGGARRTERFTADRLATDGAAHLAFLADEGGAMVQPYLKAVEGERERSLVYLGGAFSHAFLKAPFANTYDQAVAYGPSEAELDVGRRTLEAVGEPLAYARVDLIPTADGPALMELEVIEPSLLMASAPGSERRFADILLAQSALSAATS